MDAISPIKTDAPEAIAADVSDIARAHPGPIVAWTVEIHSMTCVVFATTKAKAQWIATKSYWEAYDRRRGEWPRAKAWRAKPYDNSRLRFEGPKAWSEDHVLDCLNISPAPPVH